MTSDTNIGPEEKKQPSDLILESCQAVGHTFLHLFETVGRLSVFMGRSLLHIIMPPLYFRLILKQIMDIGYYSLPVVGMTALFTGMVLALQSYTGFTRFNAESAIAGVVVLSVTRELGACPCRSYGRRSCRGCDCRGNRHDAGDGAN